MHEVPPGSYQTWRDSKGMWRGVCYRCGFTGRWRHEHQAVDAAETHMCTHPEEGQAA